VDLLDYPQLWRKTHVKIFFYLDIHLYVHLTLGAQVHIFVSLTCQMTSH